MQQLIQLYRNLCGAPPERVEALAKAGSNREYVRFHGRDGRTMIGVIGPSTDENRCFIHLSRHFRKNGLPVPEILAVADDDSRYLQTDLGTLSLYQALQRGRDNGACYDERETALLVRTIRLLPHVQVEGARGLDFSKCLPPVAFDTQAAMFDLNYFKYCFLRTTDLPHDEVRLEQDFRQLAADLVADGSDTFLYRDFQARNVMLVKPESPGGEWQPYFIDFQGGQRGPMQYDVASFLWQASARYPQTLRERLIDEYLDELLTLHSLDTDSFRRRLHLFVLFRILQVLGAYGLRGYFERKKYFIDSIPPAIQNLRRMLLEGVADNYPYLGDVLRRMVELPQFNPPVSAPKNAAEAPAGTPAAAPAPAASPLVVRVFSFSYKRGIPDDPSGNGGGYVFDCRATHNPGRYEAYKQLTGLDAPVIQFLEDDGEILTFLGSVYKLADTHVRRYIERGFTSLQFAFGCTGGQHRSVYCAQHLAEYIHRQYGVEVQLTHREQQLTEHFPARGR